MKEGAGGGVWDGKERECEGSESNRILKYICNIVMAAQLSPSFPILSRLFVDSYKATKVSPFSTACVNTSVLLTEGGHCTYTKNVF